MSCLQLVLSALSVFFPSRTGPRVADTLDNCRRRSRNPVPGRLRRQARTIRSLPSASFRPGSCDLHGDLRARKILASFASATSADHRARFSLRAGVSANGRQHPGNLLDARRKDKEHIYVNRAYETITGRSCQSLQRTRLLMKRPSTLKTASHVLAKLQEATHSGQFDERFRIVRPDGEVRWVSVRGFPVRDFDGYIAGWLAPRRRSQHRSRQRTKSSRICCWRERAGQSLKHFARQHLL